MAFGRKTGVFCKDWSEIKWLVLKYVGSRFKKFNNIADGWKFVLNLNKDISAPCNLQTFTDISTEEIERFKKQHDEPTKASTSEKEPQIGYKSSDLNHGSNMINNICANEIEQHIPHDVLLSRLEKIESDLSNVSDQNKILRDLIDNYQKAIESQQDSYIALVRRCQI